MFRLALTLFLLALTGLSIAAGPRPVRYMTGVFEGVFMTAPVGDTNRFFVVEQHTGNIRVFNRTSNTFAATPFLTQSGLGTNGEQGLLGMAFHPDYANNGHFYIHFTDTGDDVNIVRYTVSANPNIADAATSQTVLKIDHPQKNHNGGWLGFGPDGYLYVAVGDGGFGNDDGPGHTPGIGNAQDTTDNLLGKILRLDVNGDDFPGDAQRNYAIPPTNPFVGVSGDDEIWAFGLRNPWRCSFDRSTNDFWIGDVGQNQREEIDFQHATWPGAANYGWRLREGTIQTGTVGGPPPPGNIEPVYDYSHGTGSNQGFAVIGGYVYRGPNALLYGRYFFADNATERIWSLNVDRDTGLMVPGSFRDWTTDFIPNIGTIDFISSFGEDHLGNLYVIDQGGQVYRIEFGDYTINAANPGGNGMSNGTSDEFRIVILGSTTEIYINGNFSQSFDTEDINTLTFVGSADDDTLTVDFASGSPVPPGGIFFTGAGQASGDSLMLAGGGPAFADAQYTFTNASDGTITVDNGTITYTGLEPIVDTLDVASRTFLLNDSGNAASLENVGGGVLRLSGDSSETVDFNAPTSSLLLLTGDGDDVVTAEELGLGPTVSLVIQAGAGDDQVLATPGINYPVSADGGAHVAGDFFEFDGSGTFASGDFSSGVISMPGAVNTTVSGFESGSLGTSNVPGWSIFR